MHSIVAFTKMRSIDLRKLFRIYIPIGMNCCDNTYTYNKVMEQNTSLQNDGSLHKRCM